MKKIWDHFHAEFITADNEKGEIEGGFISLPPHWENYHILQKEWWLEHLAYDWGMPRNVKLIGFRLAG